MSEQRNVESLTAIYEAFGRGDVGYIVDQLAEDVHWFSHGEPDLPTSGDWSGKANAAGFFRAIGENIDITSFTPSEVVADGDTVVSTGRETATVRSTGKTYDTAWVFIWKFRGEQVVSYEQFHDWTFADAFH